MNYDEMKKQVRLIDFDIVKLLSKRMELSLRIRKLEEQIKDPLQNEPPYGDKEKEAVNIYFNGLIKEEFHNQIFSRIKEETQSLLQRNPLMMGFQGEHGAFGDVAARKYNPALIPIPCMEFADVFEGVIKGQLDMGIVPVENSLEGAVTHVNDLLVDNDIKIAGEVEIPVTHCLLAIPGTDHRDIKVVYSHPQALAQCRGFLARNRLEPRPYYNTAGAAKMLSQERPSGSAVIASSLCAKLYNLQIIKEGIEDHELNRTRFVVLSLKESTQEGDKCTVVFTTSHKVGTLHRVLQIFAHHRINLTRIESRPIRNNPCCCAFLVDFEGSRKEERVQKVLTALKEETSSLKYLGCYKKSS